MSDVLHKICDYLAHDYLVAALDVQKPFLASLIEDGPIEDEDVDGIYTMAYGPSLCHEGIPRPNEYLQAAGEYQRLRGVSTAGACRSTRTSGACASPSSGSLRCLLNSATDSRTSRR